MAIFNCYVSSPEGTNHENQMDKQTFRNCCLKWWTHLLSLEFLDPGGSGKYWRRHSSQDEANPTLRQGPRRISQDRTPVPTSSIISIHRSPCDQWNGALLCPRTEIPWKLGPCCKLRSQLDHIAGYLRPPLLHWDLHDDNSLFFQQKMGVNWCGTHWEEKNVGEDFTPESVIKRGFFCPPIDLMVASPPETYVRHWRENHPTSKRKGTDISSHQVETHCFYANDIPWSPHHIPRLNDLTPIKLWKKNKLQTSSHRGFPS